MQSLKKIGQKLLKLESPNNILHQSRAIWSSIWSEEEKHIFTSIKGHNSVVYKQI